MSVVLALVTLSLAWMLLYGAWTGTSLRSEITYAFGGGSPPSPPPKPKK